MRIDTATLTPEAHNAIVECLKIAARRGRELRLAREREQQNPLAIVSVSQVADGKSDQTDGQEPEPTE